MGQSCLGCATFPFPLCARARLRHVSVPASRADSSTSCSRFSVAVPFPGILCPVPDFAPRHAPEHRRFRFRLRPWYSPASYFSPRAPARVPLPSPARARVPFAFLYPCQRRVAIPSPRPVHALKSVSSCQRELSTVEPSCLMKYAAVPSNPSTISAPRRVPATNSAVESASASVEEGQ